MTRKNGKKEERSNIGTNLPKGIIRRESEGGSGRTVGIASGWGRGGECEGSGCVIAKSKNKEDEQVNEIKGGTKHSDAGGRKDNNRCWRRMGNWFVMARRRHPKG